VWDVEEWSPGQIVKRSRGKDKEDLQKQINSNDYEKAKTGNTFHF